MKVSAEFATLSFQNSCVYMHGNKFSMTDRHEEDKRYNRIKRLKCYSFRHVYDKNGSTWVFWRCRFKAGSKKITKLLSGHSPTKSHFTWCSATMNNTILLFCFHKTQNQLWTLFLIYWNWSIIFISKSNTFLLPSFSKRGLETVQ